MRLLFYYLLSLVIMRSIKGNFIAFHVIFSDMQKATVKRNSKEFSKQPIEDSTTPYPLRVFPFRCMIHICINDIDNCLFFFHTLSLALLPDALYAAAKRKWKTLKYKQKARRKVLERERKKNYYKHKNEKSPLNFHTHIHAALFTLRTLSLYKSHISRIDFVWKCLVDSLAS